MWQTILLPMSNMPSMIAFVQKFHEICPEIKCTNDEQLAVIGSIFPGSPFSQGDTLQEFMEQFTYTEEQQHMLLTEIIPLMISIMDEPPAIEQLYIQLRIASTL